MTNHFSQEDIDSIQNILSQNSNSSITSDTTYANENIQEEIKENQKKQIDLEKNQGLLEHKNLLLEEKQKELEEKQINLMVLQKSLENGQTKLEDGQKDLEGIGKKFNYILGVLITLIVGSILVWYVDTFFIYQSIKENYIESTENIKSKIIEFDIKFETLKDNIGDNIKENNKNISNIEVSVEKIIEKEVELQLYKKMLELNRE